jgi:hypothetical protein
LIAASNSERNTRNHPVADEQSALHIMMAQTVLAADDA